MPRTVDYFLAPQSPWTYLGHERFVRIARETRYYAEPFPAPEWRAQWAEPIG